MQKKVRDPERTAMRRRIFVNLYNNGVDAPTIARSFELSSVRVYQELGKARRMGVKVRKGFYKP